MSNPSNSPGTAWHEQYKQLAQWTMRHLVNRTDVWGQYIAPGRRASGNTAITQPRKDRRGKDHLTEQQLGYHYAGKRLDLILGLHSTSIDNTSRFLVFDIDLHDEIIGDLQTNWEIVCKLDACIQRLGLFPLIEDSNGNGGYHIWIIFHDPAPTKDVYTLGRMILKQAGAPESIEIFPKQAKLDGDRLGNWIRLPGRHHTRDHWSRFYKDSQWVNGEAAVKCLLEAPVNDPKLLVDISPIIQEVEKPNLKLTSDKEHIQECKDYLSRLSHQRADSYDTWIKVGQALHSVDDDAEMLSLWDTWSQQSAKHRAGECLEKWVGFQQERGLTIRSLRKWANQDTPIDRKEDKRNSVQILIDIIEAEAQELWHASDKTTYITMEQNGWKYHRAISGSWFPQWLYDRYSKERPSPPSRAAIETAIAFIDSQAAIHGKEYEVFLRVAHHRNQVYIDLGDDTGEVIEISADGWRIISSPPVRFLRPPTMRSLPRPLANGNIDALRPFLNVRSEDDFRLVVAYILMALRGKGPYPILNFEGEHGSAKSMHTRVSRMLIDPAHAPLRTLPKDERDLAITARENHLLAFDNISYLTDEVSDALCRMATGGGLGTRKLYTDKEEVVFDSIRPLIINGITELATRPDLRSRVIIISLPAIPDSERKDEEEIVQALDDALPTILGGLYTAVSCALRNYSTTKLKLKPRMADFARWITAAEPALNWSLGSFLTAYQNNQNMATIAAVENDTIAREVIRFAKLNPWTGTASDLLRHLTDQAGPAALNRAWPQTPRKLSGCLRRIVSDLRAVGVEVTWLQRTHARLIEVVRVSGEFMPADSENF